MKLSVAIIITTDNFIKTDLLIIYANKTMQIHALHFA